MRLILKYGTISSLIIPDIKEQSVNTSQATPAIEFTNILYTSQLELVVITMHLTIVVFLFP